MTLTLQERVDENRREVERLRSIVESLTTPSQATVREIWWAKTAANTDQSPSEQYPTDLDSVWFWARLIERYNPAARPYSPDNDDNLTTVSLGSPTDPSEVPGQWVQIFHDGGFIREGAFVKVWRFVNRNEWFAFDTGAVQVFREGFDQEGGLELTGTGLSDPPLLVDWASSSQFPNMVGSGGGGGIITFSPSIDPELIFVPSGWYEIFWGARIDYRNIVSTDMQVVVEVKWETDLGTSGVSYSALKDFGREGASGNGASVCVKSPEVQSGGAEQGEVSITGKFYNRFVAGDRIRLRATRTAHFNSADQKVSSAYFIIAPLYQVPFINAPDLGIV